MCARWVRKSLAFVSNCYNNKIIYSEVKPKVKPRSHNATERFRR